MGSLYLSLDDVDSRQISMISNINGGLKNDDRSSTPDTRSTLSYGSALGGKIKAKLAEAVERRKSSGASAYFFPGGIPP